MFCLKIIMPILRDLLLYKRIVKLHSCHLMITTKIEIEIHLINLHIPEYMQKW